VSSDGLIRIFDLGDVLRALGAHQTEQPVVVEPVTQYDTKGSRLTCVAMGDGELVADTQQIGKRKRNDEVDDALDDWPSEVEEEEGGAEGDGEVDKSDNGEQESD
jgi:protein MAK11